MESEAAAADRGAVDKAIVSLLACCFRVGCAGRKRRRSAGRTCRTRRTGRGIVVYVRRSKTDQDASPRTCAALRQLRDRITV